MDKKCGEVEMIDRKAFNEKLAESIGNVLVNILHDENAQYVDQTQITKNLCKIFSANEWETQFIFSRIVSELTTTRFAIWHIMARKISEHNTQSSINKKNRNRWK